MVSADGTSSRSIQISPTAPFVADVAAARAVEDAMVDVPASAVEPSSSSAEQKASSNRVIERRTPWGDLVRPTRRRFECGRMVSLPTGAEAGHVQHHNSETAEHA